MSIRKTLILTAILSLLALLSGSCSQAKGSLQVYVTDALPKEVTAVEIKAANIQVHKADASEDSWVTVLNDPPVFDLVKIAGIEKLLGTSELASGNYTQVRLNIISANVTLNGKQVQALVPSDSVKLIGTFTIEEGKKTPIVLDFDGEKSVVIAGTDNVQLKPTIKLIVGEPEVSPTPPTISNTTAQ